jgi:NADH-quinone oxidoreductase subunit K
MTLFTLSNALTVSLLLVLIGAFGVLRRRSLILVLLSVEILLNGANFALISFNHFLWAGREIGHYLYMLSIGVAAVEAAVGLAMVIALFRQSRDVSRDRLAGFAGEGTADESGWPDDESNAPPAPEAAT